MQPRHIVIATFGSLGDVLPYLAIGRELIRRGHRATIATAAYYGPRVEAAGIGFHAVPPDYPHADPGFQRRFLHPRTGGAEVVRNVVFPVLRETYEALEPLLRGADAVVTQCLAYSAMLYAEKSGMPWVSSLLSPLPLFSRTDSPVADLRMLPFRTHFPAMNYWVNRIGQWSVGNWLPPWLEMRRSLGLGPRAHPVFAGQHSPFRMLALFSELFAPRQPDWPAQSRITGFPFYDDPDERLDPEVDTFLSNGPPPLVFTLGSSASLQAGNFAAQSIAAARKLEMRALLIATGDQAPASNPEAGILVVRRAPFAQVFPRSAAVVHHGGVGTCAEVLRAGRPSLAVPYAHDQPENAARLFHMGVALPIRQSRYRSPEITRLLSRLLNEPEFRSRAEAAGERIRAERGVSVATDAIEDVAAGR